RLGSGIAGRKASICREDSKRSAARRAAWQGGGRSDQDRDDDAGVGRSFCGERGHARAICAGISRARLLRKLEPEQSDQRPCRMSVVTTAIAALSAITAAASLLAYLHFVRRADLSSAREEALALAETRREIIRELHVQLRGADER